MTTALGAIPARRESTDSSISNQTIADLKVVRVAFFAGDDIGFIEKYEMPNVKGFGGLFLPHIKTLPKENKGMLYRCQLTPLKTAMIPQPALMLAPGERETWSKSFTQSNAKQNPDGTYSDVVISGFTESNAAKMKETGQFETRKNDFQLYKERYPGHDIQEITKRSEPHGAGGVVEVPALKGATQDEIDAAQLFFFPDWYEISAGTKFLPETMRELEDMLRKRISAIAVECPFELRGKYNQIAQAMIKSCTEFRQAYLTTFQKNEIIMKDSAAKGNTGASYHPRTEDAMRLLEYRRKDDIVAGDSSSVDRLARIMEQKELGNTNLEAQKIELELLRERNRAKELELQAAEAQHNIIKERVTVKNSADAELASRIDGAYLEAKTLSGGTVAVIVTDDMEVAKAELAEKVANANAEYQTQEPVDASHIGEFQPITQDAQIAAIEATQAATMDTIMEQTPQVLGNQVGTRLCGQPTASGSPCERELKTGEVNCWQHNK